jgi:hypothetical protein
MVDSFLLDIVAIPFFLTHYIVPIISKFVQLVVKPIFMVSIFKMKSYILKANMIIC